ncbi:hypothetical protein GIB67_021690 [Kingdonia uniflora]|uniref:PPPDE domain-containing protein n=1 Tax=Kingdonia uniflora TaxID=39325 RepID=A0A7J7LMD0_9MAGN|nr:hypothetical protein GIB67_021690 [Kingdonia uniflora]
MLNRILPCKKNQSGSVPVFLNVYDLTPINGYAYWFGLGVYHSGVEVDGVEYAFGAHAFHTTGIFEGMPKQCAAFTFRKSILIGRTDMGSKEVRSFMKNLAVGYAGDTYNLITKNCNHFCNDVCIRLTGKRIPSWVNRLAKIGFLCNCVLPVGLNEAKVRSDISDEQRVYDMEKKKFRSHSTRFVSRSSSSSSGSVGLGNSSRHRCPPSSTSNVVLAPSSTLRVYGGGHRK